MDHVVTHPTPPFSSRDGKLEVHQIPAWKDNLIWLLVERERGEVAVVDGPEAGPALAYCEAKGLRLGAILNTHTHPDHVGINHELVSRGLPAGFRVIGPALSAADVPGIDERVDEGDEVRLGDITLCVMRTEGHMNGHISFVYDDLLFCGDTLFAAGCGYLFDGPPAKMFESLARLSALDPATRVCCAHEYTEDNLRFAWSVEPDNEALAERIRRVFALRARGECSLPSTIAEELETNPFLRSGSPTIRRTVAEAFPERTIESEADVFAATRALKDRKDYRAMGDEALPID